MIFRRTNEAVPALHAAALSIRTGITRVDNSVLVLKASLPRVGMRFSCHSVVYKTPNMLHPAVRARQANTLH